MFIGFSLMLMLPFKLSCIATPEGMRTQLKLTLPGSPNARHMSCQPVYAIALQVAESWAFGMLVLFAGLLPDPTRAVASTSIAFNTYGITYMPFLAESIAVSTRCGHSSTIRSLLSPHMLLFCGQFLPGCQSCQCYQCKFSTEKKGGCAGWVMSWARAGLGRHAWQRAPRWQSRR